MKAISQFVVHVFDLIEAEGSSFRAAFRSEAKLARSAATDMLMCTALLCAAVPIFLGGIILCIAGLLWWLETHVGKPLAASLAGLAMLVIAGGCVVGFRALARRRAP